MSSNYKKKGDDFVEREVHQIYLMDIRMRMCMFEKDM